MNTKSEQKLFRRIHRDFESDIYFFCLTLLRNISDSEKVAKSVFETAYETFVPSANLQQLRRALYISAVHAAKIKLRMTKIRFSRLGIRILRKRKSFIKKSLRFRIRRAAPQCAVILRI